MAKLKRVYITQDESGHWYIIPHNFKEDFDKMSEESEYGDWDEFEKKFGQYRTGGDLNLKRLYAVV